MAKKTKIVTATTGVAELVARLNKRFGTGTAISGKQLSGMRMEFYRTRVAALDIALRGGLAYNRIVEVIGEEGTCKSTLMALVSQSFRDDNPKGITLYGDLENALDPTWFVRNGCDVEDRFLAIHSDSGEQAGDVFDEALAQREVPIQVIIDSIMCLVPENELESTMDSHFVGAQPALINRVIRVCNARLKMALVGAVARTSVVLVNQTRPKIGAFIPMMDSSGGQVRKFLSSQRIQFSNGSQAESREDFKEGDFKVTERHSRKVNFNIFKNKTGGMEQTGHFMFYNRQVGDIPFGMDNAEAVLNYGLLYHVLRREANTVFFGKSKLGGTANFAMKHLRENPAVFEAVYNEITSAVASEYVDDEPEAPAPVARPKLRIGKKVVA